MMVPITSPSITIVGDGLRGGVLGKNMRLICPFGQGGKSQLIGRRKYLILLNEGTGKRILIKCI